jgi:HSP20 family protein
MGIFQRTEIDAMNNFLVPWEIRTPRMFDGLHRDMHRLINEFFGEENGGERQICATPRTNIAETEKAYEITLDLPGLKPEEFNVEFSEGQLRVTGERKQETEEKGKTYHRVERRYGQLRRVIPLEAAVDGDAIQAEYKDGVLRVNLPKKETSQPKRIEVKA